MTRFLQYWEINEHEGERWRFWLQLDGNSEAINLLEGLIHDDESYLLTDETASEEEVDILVKWSDSGYMQNENKVTGRLVVPEDFDEDALYKGGIRHLFDKEG